MRIDFGGARYGNTGSATGDIDVYRVGEGATIAQDHGTDVVLTDEIPPINHAPVIANLDGDVGVQLEGVYDTNFLDLGRDAVITDDGTDFAGGSLRVTITSGFHGDTIYIYGDSVTDVAWPSGDVLVNGVVIGTLTGGAFGYPASNVMTIEFNQNATVEAVQALLRGIYVMDQQSEPTRGTREIEITLTDGHGTANGGSDSVTYHTQLIVNTVNNEPTGTDSTLVIDEDSPYTLTTTDFGFLPGSNNPFGFEHDQLNAVEITTLPNNGLLTLDGVPVGAGQFVSAADIDAGKLAFTPAPDASGYGYANFSFQVQDNGGTDNGGVDLDQSPNTLFIDVVPVDDAPVVTITPPNAPFAPIGGEVLVNTETAGPQSNPAITTLTGGGFVVTWTDYSGTLGDADTAAIKAQVFGADGAKVGGEFLVNSETGGGQTDPAITSLANGGFVITWTDQSGQPGSTDLPEIKAQLFDAAGAKVGGEIPVNSVTSGGQSSPTVTALAGGGFVVTWEDAFGAGGDGNDSGVVAQMFDATGVKVGGEFVINSHVEGAQYRPTITALTGGGFAITWQDLDRQEFGNFIHDVKTQAFDATGAKVGGEVLVNALNAGNHVTPAIAGLADGGYVVVWNDESFTLGDEESGAIHAQRFDGSGHAVGSEFLVNTQTASSQVMPKVIALASGGFVVSWVDFSHTLGDEDGSGIKAQAFDASGAKIGGELLVNTVTAGLQFFPALAELHDGRLAVVWADYSGALGDSDAPGIALQLLGASPLGYVATEQVALDLKGTLAITDVDADNMQISAVLHVDYGVLHVDPATSQAEVSGNDTDTVTITGTLEQINDALSTNPNSRVTFTANTDTPPDSAVLTLTVEGTSSGAAIAIQGLNDAPTGADATIAVHHGVPYTVTLADFGYGDIDGNAFSSVTIASIPTDGRLLLGNGSGLRIPVTAGQIISVADIAAGRLVYKPTPGLNDAPTGSFSFQVHDDGGTANGGIDTDPTSNTITFSVPPNHAPTGADATIAVHHGEPYTVTLADFGYGDIDGNAFSSVTIASIPTDGRLLLGNGSGLRIPVTAGQIISVADIAAGRLVYKPTPGLNDAQTGSFNFQVHDDGGTANGGIDTDPTSNTITFDARPQGSAVAHDSAMASVAVRSDAHAPLAAGGAGAPYTDTSHALVLHLPELAGAHDLPIDLGTVLADHSDLGSTVDSLMGGFDSSQFAAHASDTLDMMSPLGLHGELHLAKDRGLGHDVWVG